MKRLSTILTSILLLTSYIPLPCASAQATSPEGPRAKVDTAFKAPTGLSIPVAAGGNLQAALDRAQPGDEVVLATGANFIGNFALKFRNVLIRWAESGKLLEGKRVTPADMVGAPKILSPNNMGAIYTIGPVSGYRFIGIEVSVTAGMATTNTGLIRFGVGDEAALAALSTDMIVDRCWVHGTATANTTRGVALNSISSAVIDSTITEIHAAGFDSQAVAGWNGPGPFKITNNTLEAAGENVMFGGADPKITGLVPSDIEIKRNDISKPLSWRGQPWTVKNLFELKNARRVLVEGNRFSTTWAQAQAVGINIKSANQEGTAPWSVTEDLAFINNIVSDVPMGISINGADPNTPQRTKRVLVANNLWINIDSTKYGGNGNFAQIIGGAQGVEVRNNTVIQTGNIISADGEPTTGLVFVNNIVKKNSYGVKGSGQAEGTGTLAFYFPASVFKKNLLIGASSTVYPPENYFASDISAVGFVDVAAANYRLRLPQPLGTDGKPVGADLDAIEAAMRGNVTPAPGPGPSPIVTPNYRIDFFPDGSIVVKDKTGAVVFTGRPQ